MDRNFKNIHSGILQLRQSIKVALSSMQECENAIAGNMNARNESFKAEEAAILKTVASKLDRNKKEVMKTLEDSRVELKNRLQLGGSVADRVKKQAEDIDRQYMSQIGRLHEHIGSLRCEMEFMYEVD